VVDPVAAAADAGRSRTYRRRARSVIVGLRRGDIGARNARWVINVRYPGAFGRANPMAVLASGSYEVETVGRLPPSVEDLNRWRNVRAQYLKR